MKDEIPLVVLRNLEKAQAALRPSVEEVRERFGPLLAQWQAERQRERQPSFAAQIQELWQGFGIRLMEGMREFEAGLAEVAADRAYATRSVEAAAPATPGERVFIQEGINCFGRVALKPGETGRMTLELSLRDKSLRAIKPFRLTVRCEDGRVLLDAKQIDGEAYVVKDLEPAGYEFLLESASGKEQVRFGWRTEQA